MSIDNAVITKLTGLDLMTATQEAKVKKIVGNNAKKTDLMIANCLIIRHGISVDNWQSQEVAESLGMSASQVALMGRKGTVLYTIGGPATALPRQYHQMSVFSTKEIDDLTNTIIETQGDAEHSIEEMRGETLRRNAIGKVTNTRLGTNSTPEKVLAIVEAAIAEGIHTPQDMKKRVAAIATALEIKLPVIERAGGPKKKVEDVSEVPNFDRDLAKVLAAIKDLRDGADEDYPLALTEKQFELAAEVMDALAALTDEAELWVPTEVREIEGQVIEPDFDYETAPQG